MAQVEPHDLLSETHPRNGGESKDAAAWMMLFWLLPPILALAQLWVTWRLGDRIAYEEIAESVRDPYWLGRGALYDRGSPNVAWYAAMLGLYKTFGFHLHLARVFRLILHVLSITSVAWLFKRLLGVKRALVPLCAFALSPSLLFFNGMQTSYGSDLQLVPICLVLLVLIPAASLARSLVLQALCWSLAMVGALAYPAFAMLYPTLGIAYLVVVRRFCADKHWSIHFASLLVGGLAFVLTFVGFAALLRDPSPLWQGAFRGGAGGFSTSPAFILANLGRTFRELFERGESYYFVDLPKVEFSGGLGALSACLAIVTSALVARDRKLRLFLVLAWLTILTTLAISATATHLPGLRRQTPVLGAFYVLYALAWHQLGLGHKRAPLVRVLAFVLLLLPVHHLIVLPENAAHGRGDGFSPVGTQPTVYLRDLTAKATTEEVELRCPSPSLFKCRYPEVFAAVAGACEWNHLRCQPVQGYDPKTARFVPLSTALWETYYFSH